MNFISTVSFDAFYVVEIIKDFDSVHLFIQTNQKKRETPTIPDVFLYISCENPTANIQIITQIYVRKYKSQLLCMLLFFLRKKNLLILISHGCD